MSLIQPALTRLTLLSLIFVVSHTVAADDAGLLPSANVVGEEYLSAISLRTYSNSSKEDEVRRLLDLYIDARSAGMMEEADSLAKQIVVVSIGKFGRDSVDTADALTNLADFQAKYGDPIAAIQNFEAAIEIVERVENDLSMQLVDPLNALGVLQYRAGNTELAQAVWQRAVHIGHVNLGPHNNQQIETLYSIERSLIEAGKGKEARRMRRRILYLEFRDTNRSGKGVLTAGAE